MYKCEDPAGLGRTWFVFENRVKDVPRGWRSLHDKELLNIYASSNNIMAIISRRMQWALV
jgi:hypothetical protein